MRVALVSDCYLPRCGGIETQVHDLAIQLRRAGHTAVVLTATPGSPAGMPVLRYPVLAGVPTRAALDDLRRTVTSGGFDVVHAHSSLLSPLAWSAARFAADGGVPAVVTMHSLPPPETTPVALLLAQVGRRLGPRVRWTAVSGVAAAALRDMLPGGSVEVLPNGIDPRPWRRTGPMAGRPLTVVSTMRMVQRKRPGALLRILGEVRRQVPPAVPVRAIVVGAGPRAAGLERAVRRRGLAPWVELPGRLPRAEIQALYAQADVYLAPARLESFGIAALEARCAGLAVVAMAAGGVGEFVRHGVEGYLVDDDHALATAAAYLLNEPGVLRAMQRHNRSTLPAMTWESVIDDHLRLYALSAFSQQRPGVLRA